MNLLSKYTWLLFSLSLAVVQTMHASGAGAYLERHGKKAAAHELTKRHTVAATKIQRAMRRKIIKNRAASAAQRAADLADQEAMLIEHNNKIIEDLNAIIPAAQVPYTSAPIINTKNKNIIDQAVAVFKSYKDSANNSLRKQAAEVRTIIMNIIGVCAFRDSTQLADLKKMVEHRTAETKREDLAHLIVMDDTSEQILIFPQENKLLGRDKEYKTFCRCQGIFSNRPRSSDPLDGFYSATETYALSLNHSYTIFQEGIETFLAFPMPTLTTATVTEFGSTIPKSPIKFKDERPDYKIFYTTFNDCMMKGDTPQVSHAKADEAVKAFNESPAARMPAKERAGS